VRNGTQAGGLAAAEVCCGDGMLRRDGMAQLGEDMVELFRRTRRVAG
jgi:hypothetical protein